MKNRFRRILSIILVLTLVLSSTIAVNANEENTTEASITFSDIKSTDWFYNNVTEMVMLGIVNGYEDGTFRPQGAVQVDEFIKMALVAMGYEPSTSDSTYWADGYITKAEELKITDKTFINDYRYELTREQASRIITNAIYLKENHPSDTYTEYIKKAIQDYHLVADKYKQDVIDCYTLGIMQGDTYKKINPQKTITRAETTAVILRMINKDRRLPVEFETTKSISGYSVDGNYYTLVAPILNGEPVNEMIEVSYILRDSIVNTKGSECFSMTNVAAGISGYSTEEKMKAYNNAKTEDEIIETLEYRDFDFSVNFMDYKGKYRPYMLFISKYEANYDVYFLNLYVEPFEKTFKLLFEDEFDTAWGFLKTALKGNNTENIQISKVINDRYFFINYNVGALEMYISLKGQWK